MFVKKEHLHLIQIKIKFYTIKRLTFINKIWIPFLLLACAGKAQKNCGIQIQTFGFDFFVAMAAIAVIAAFNPRQCDFDPLDFVLAPPFRFKGHGLALQGVHS